MKPQTFAHKAQWPSWIKNPRLELYDFIYYYRFVPDITLLYLNRQIIPSSFSLFPLFYSSLPTPNSIERLPALITTASANCHHLRIP
jgi:hypothetical protein